MSAILEPRSRIALRERTLPDFDPVVDSPQPRTKQRTRPRQRVSRLALAARFTTNLALISFVSFGVSAGVCQYMFEEARRDANTATTRAQKAQTDLAGLRRVVDRLQSAERVQTWAALNGFVPSYLASDERHD
ncbi:MAG: hypothetical protein M3R13_06410 [Armatimonadota bacterium]|nr:hypothetical protein [Armatimonadota bacterium]